MGIGLSKKRILIIQNSLGGGGAERVLATVLNSFDKSRYDVTLLLIYKEGVFVTEIPEWVEVKYLYEDSSGFSHRVITHFSFIRNRCRHNRALKVLGDVSFDAIISFMEGPTARLHADLMGLSVMNISWVHSDVDRGRWYGFWFKEDEEKRFYQNIDKVAFVSDEAKEAFKRRFKTGAELKVIYNPVDVEAIERKGKVDRLLKTDRFKIVTVGRLIRVKRQDRLIEAVSILRKKGYELDVEIIGSGPLECELRNMAMSSGVDDCVSFSGFMTNPFPCVAMADLFCLTSESEGFGMVVAEALALGVPVVSTRVTGVSEVLSNGGGVLTGHGSDEIAEAIEMLINDRNRLDMLRAEAKAAVARFRPNQIMKSIEAFIGV